MARIRSVTTVADLDVVRREVLGKSGTLPGLRRGVGALPAEERRTVSAAIHEAQQGVTAAIEAREQELLDTESALPRPLDVTLPGLPAGPGGLHPTIQLMYDLNDAFAALNFDRYADPEISSELYEFDNLNFPPEHPARESMDTFWLTGMIAGIRVMGGSRLTAYRMAVLPQQVLWISTTIKLALPTAVATDILAEFVAANQGLGYLMNSAAGTLDTASLLAEVIFVSVVVTVVIGLLAIGERWWFRWQVRA